MQNDFRSMLAEGLIDRLGVAHIAKQSRPRHPGIPLGHFHVDLVERMLTLLEQHDLCRLQPGDLPHQFRTDGATGAGDQHATATDQPGHGGAVKRPLRTARSEEHTTELQSLMLISDDVFCWKQKTTTHTYT